MEDIMQLIQDNYIIFAVALILVFALIGFIVDKSSKKKDGVVKEPKALKVKKEKKKGKKDNVEEVQPVVEENQNNFVQPTFDSEVTNVENFNTQVEIPTVEPTVEPNVEAQIADTNSTFINEVEPVAEKPSEMDNYWANLQDNTVAKALEEESQGNNLNLDLTQEMNTTVPPVQEVEVIPPVEEVTQEENRIEVIPEPENIDANTLRQEVTENPENKNQ